MQTIAENIIDRVFRSMCAQTSNVQTEVSASADEDRLSDPPVSITASALRCLSFAHTHTCRMQEPKNSRV